MARYDVVLGKLMSSRALDASYSRYDAMLGSMRHPTTDALVSHCGIGAIWPGVQVLLQLSPALPERPAARPIRSGRPWLRPCASRAFPALVSLPVQARAARCSCRALRLRI